MLASPICIDAVSRVCFRMLWFPCVSVITRKLNFEVEVS